MKKAPFFLSLLILLTISIFSSASPTTNCKVFFPNIFSPNGQGDPDNDTFRPFLPADCTYSDFELTIYDRWGKLVFKSNSPEQSWDGTFQGTAMKADVYVYILKIKFQENAEGKTEVFSGDVALVR